MNLSKALLAIACLGAVSLPAVADLQAFSRHRERVLGTSFDLVVMAETEIAADRVEAAILNEIDRLATILSNYDAGSEVSQLNTKAEAVVSSDLIKVLTTCEALRKQTNDAVSCRIGQAISVWNQAEEMQAIPDRANLRLIAGQARRAGVAIDKATGTVARPEPVAFRTDALAKGYIIDKALEAARKAAPDAEGVLINIGGDQRAWGAGPHAGKWRTGISSLPASASKTRGGMPVLGFSSGALATSGTGPRDRVIGGEHFGHILSPVDGWPAGGKLQASVYAQDAMTADALATALMVLDISDALELIEGMADVEALIVADDGRLYSTSGWAALEDDKISPVSAIGPSSWPEGYQLVVDLEVPDLKVSKYERPYVAAWIADANRNLIRILMLAGDEPRWMEENYYWYRRFGRKAGSLVDAMSGPTRRPGVYSLVWDGFDDDGGAVPPGDYILHVEAAREHGDHQHSSIDLPLSGGAFTESIPAETELGEIRVRFGLPQ